MNNAKDSNQPGIGQNIAKDSNQPGIGQNIAYLDWPAPKSVKACYTLRSGGHSTAPYASFNLGDHVDDVQASVNANRQKLRDAIGQESICWLQQIHGTKVVDASSGNGAQADACYTQSANQVCNVMTADCLPVFFCNTQGTQVAVAHAGWRGLHAGILQQTLRQFQCCQDSPSSSNRVMAYLGPAISQAAFEVGDDVRDAFLSLPRDQLDTASQHFKVKQKSVHGNKWMADLYGLAKNMLQNMGVVVYGSGFCTYSESEKFFSYRRDGVTGRMANLIWLEKD